MVLCTGTVPVGDNFLCCFYFHWQEQYRYNKYNFIWFYLFIVHNTEDYCLRGLVGRACTIRSLCRWLAAGVGSRFYINIYYEIMCKSVSMLYFLKNWQVSSIFTYFFPKIILKNNKNKKANLVVFLTGQLDPRKIEYGRSLNTVWFGNCIPLQPA